MPAIVLCLLLSFPFTAVAESALRLSNPRAVGDVAALVYAPETGERIGEARLSMRRLQGGGLRMMVETRLDGSGEASLLDAELEPLPNGDLRPRVQRSRTLDAQGHPVVAVTIRHDLGEVRCTSADGRDHVLELPAADRVANVPMNLVLAPVAAGAVQSVRFDTLLCRDEPRLVATEGRLAATTGLSAGGRAAEVRYRFDIGPLLSFLAGPFLPQIAVWLDPDGEPNWIGYRMPLYPKGPTVLVLREGVMPAALAAGL